MEEYFQYIVESLSIDDMSILGILYDEDCFVRMKAISNSTLYNKSNLSEAIYRKVVSKLLSIKFIEAHTENREHSYFISEYGQKAITIIFQNNDGRVLK